MMPPRSARDASAESDGPLCSSLSGPAATIWQAIAADLMAAVASARHPFHLVTVATVDETGAPQARTVVLRAFDAARREVRFHTDIRSPKAAQIRRTGRVALHWYDPTRRLQIRIAAEAAIHQGNAVARAAWEASPPRSRACYLAAEAPGTPVAAVPAACPPPDPADDRGLDAFAVVCCRFDAVELLLLRAAGHERIRLQLAGPGPISEILAP